MTVWPNTTTRPDAFRGTACCGSDPRGHANSRVGSHFPSGDPSSRLDRDRAHTNGTPRRSPVSVGAASLRHGYNDANWSGFEDGNRKSDCVTIRGNKQGGGHSTRLTTFASISPL
jgi:hypothetical protein